MKPHMSHLYTWLALLIICSVLLIGCGGSKGQGQTDATAEPTASPIPTALGISGDVNGSISGGDTVCVSVSSYDIDIRDSVGNNSVRMYIASYNGPGSYNISWATLVTKPSDVFWTLKKEISL